VKEITVFILDRLDKRDKMLLIQLLSGHRDTELNNATIPYNTRDGHWSPSGPASYQVDLGGPRKI